MGSSYWLITVGSIGILAASIALQIRTYSRRRPVRPIVIALGQAAAFASMVLFSVSLGRPPGVVEWVLILAVGVACGAAYGGLVRVEQTPAGIVMAYTLPWLVVWGALLLVTQGAAAITGRLPWVVYSLAIFTMTLNLGMNGRVIARHRALRIGGVVAAALVAPFLVGLLALAPAGAQPVRADGNGVSCSVDQIPELLRGLLPPQATLVEPNSGQVGQAMVVDTSTSSSGRNAVQIIYHVALPDTGLAASITDGVVISVYRDSGQADAEYGVAAGASLGGLIGQEDISGVAGPAFRIRLGPQSSGGTEYLEYQYTGLAGAAVVWAYPRTAPGTTPATSHDAFFASVMAAAGALDPGAVFALEATGSCSGGAAAAPTKGPGTPGGTTAPGGTTPSGTGVSGIGVLLDGEPIQPGDLTQGLVLANGLLILGSLGQFVMSSGGWTGGATSGPAGTPSNGTPFGDGRVWYRAPWDVGGPAPMTPAEIADIENKQRQGFIWSGTDGWVTPEQSAANEAMRAHQLAVERAESAQAAAESHRAIQAARDAQEAARQEIRNINRRAVIDIEMREAERQHAEDMAALAKADRVAWVGSAVETAGDLAATGLGIVGGPLGIAVRAGYRVLKGTAAGLGTGIADGASYGETTKRMYIGTVEGGVAAGAEMAIDGGVRKLFGLPPMFPAAPAPIPPALLAPRAVVRQVLGDAAEIAKKKGVDAAARTVDPAKVMRLYKNGGMETLGQLEQAGAVSSSEAQVIRKVLSNEVNGSVAAGARDAAREFAKKTGVRLQEVLVSDSGSSAAGKVGSLVTDADRTVVGVFHPEDVAAYAKQHGISQAEAASALNRELTSAVDEKVAEQLGRQGLTPTDVGYKGYSAFGEAAGPGDSWAAQATRTRQAVQGNTTVVRPDGTTYRAGKDAILDAEGLAARAQGGTMPPVQPTVPFSEFEQLGGRQVQSLVAHADPKSVAKAMDRVSYLAGRTGIPVDSTVAEAAKAMRAEPQSVGEILQSFGLTTDEFRTRALDTSMRFMTKLKSFGQ
jgi:hypothetical protein